MAVNLVVQDGVVRSLALKYDAQSKPELRFTLQQTEYATDGKPWVLYLPCCASGAAAERLASEIEDGEHILVTSGKLCYRRRQTKTGEQSRLEILVWQVDRLQDDATPTPEGDSTSQGEIVQPGGEEGAVALEKGQAALPESVATTLESELRARDPKTGRFVTAPKPEPPAEYIRATVLWTLPANPLELPRLLGIIEQDHPRVYTTHH